ncbi:progranulin-like [Colossoma macropomum]|uniref:progranulin-like n=1 Tax=Colossoma macropomum TaxID=42526 RepID=UPI0018648547|nr:progranulin-like [Colossoma macropomum]
MIAVLVLLMAGLVSSAVICPDGTQCQDKNTCCLTEKGYACCPYPNAVCCLDKAHCCPEDYHCNLQTQHCEKQRFPWYSFPMSPQITAEETEEKPPSPAVDMSSLSASVVHCDSYHVCPDGTTCCRSPYGTWTCCVFNIGQCCPDGIHCCPFGYHCDYTSTHCLRGKLSLPASPRIPATFNSTKQDQCCLSETGCCPQGFHCDEESRTCVNDFEKLIPAVPLMQTSDSQVKAGVIRCNTRFYCPAAYTCCRTPTGQFGCCPYRLGVCCKDGKHCCDYGYKCSPSSSQCTKGYTSIPARPKKKALIL